MRRVGSGLMSLGVLLAAASSLSAQNDQQKRFLEEERRREMDERARANADLKQDFLWEFGGWFHGELTRLDDQPDRDHRTYRYADLRLWGEVVFEQRYTAYLRLQSDYIDFNKGDQFAGEHDNVVHPLVVDEAYLDADFSWDGTELKARAGRQFESLGRGLLLNGVAYAGHLSWSAGPFSARLVLAHTIPHDDDIDQSLPNPRDSHRGFFGVEADWIFTGDHRLYFMGLVEHDFNGENEFGQKWDYNANYLGLGARGSVTGDLSYAVELVYEFGQTAGAGSTEMDPIRAFAATVSLDYVLRIDTSPILVLEYMFGSGDSDRGSVTDVASGNTSGTNDEGFLSFGFLQTGFSLFPRLSNIHILKLGGSFHPLESVEAARYLEVGAYFYYYRKAEAGQPISDPRSFRDDADIGKEFDLFLRWRIFSDLGLSVNYGLFMPGNAYDEKSNRGFISAGLSYSF